MTDFPAVQACFEGHKHYSDMAGQEAHTQDAHPAIFRLYAEIADAYLKRAGALVR